MLIKRIKIHNYKTYLDLDLDLSVNPDKPIILIGGGNGGGKTTLFEAICGALYGLNIRDKRHFISLLNDGARNTVAPKIDLEITFEGIVLGKKFPYVLKRHYEINPNGKVVTHVRMNMNGNIYEYGTFTPAAEKKRNELEVSKIIKGNLPQELSRYFLFDAMQSSELLKENVFAETIRDNIRNVMGFNKYLQLKHSAEHLLEEKTKERLAAQEERKEYEELCSTKHQKEDELKSVQEEMEQLYRYLADMKEAFDNAKEGADLARSNANEIARIKDQLESTQKQAAGYVDALNTFIQHVEVNAVVPMLAESMSAEINHLLKVKEQINEEMEHIFSEDDIARIAMKVLDYLEDVYGFSKNVDINRLAVKVAKEQRQVETQDEYSYLDESEVQALRKIVDNNAVNDFAQLDKQRQNIELFLKNIPTLQQQKDTLERSSEKGNQALIDEYGNKQAKLNELKQQESNIKIDIQTLTKRINNIDVQMQQEPDPKYDTLVKLVPFFSKVTNELLKQKRHLIETEMQRQLNLMLVSYKGHIGRVEISESMDDFNIKIYHTSGNEISLDNLNAASKQIFIQVLLMVLRNMGDYNPPVMIDTVMGVLDDDSRSVMMEEYFPKLAEQTILLCTTSEIRKDGVNSDYEKLRAYISKTYTLVRNVEEQNTHVETDYFGVKLEND